MEQVDHDVVERAVQLSKKVSNYELAIVRAAIAKRLRAREVGSLRWGAKQPRQSIVRRPRQDLQRLASMLATIATPQVTQTTRGPAQKRRRTSIFHSSDFVMGEAAVEIAVSCAAHAAVPSHAAACVESQRLSLGDHQARLPSEYQSVPQQVPEQQQQQQQVPEPVDAPGGRRQRQLKPVRSDRGRQVLSPKAKRAPLPLTHCPDLRSPMVLELYRNLLEASKLSSTTPTAAQFEVLAAQWSLKAAQGAGPWAGQLPAAAQHLRQLHDILVKGLAAKATLAGQSCGSGLAAASGAPLQHAGTGGAVAVEQQSAAAGPQDSRIAGMEQGGQQWQQQSGMTRLQAGGVQALLQQVLPAVAEPGQAPVAQKQPGSQKRKTERKKRNSCNACL